MRCSYCGQNHHFDPTVPTPSPIAPTPPRAAVAAPSWRIGVIAACAVALVALVAGAVIVLRTASPTSSSAAAADDGPGDAGASYHAGESVDVYWGSSWWPGTIKQVDGAGRYRIGYDGWNTSWDEDVTPRRLRRRSAASPASPVAAAHGRGDIQATYRAGELVDIHWGSRWWPGRILSVEGQQYRISYDGWSSSHDETVDATRLRRR